MSNFAPLHNQTQFYRCSNNYWGWWVQGWMTKWPKCLLSNMVRECETLPVFTLPISNLWFKQLLWVSPKISATQEELLWSSISIHGARVCSVHKRLFVAIIYLNLPKLSILVNKYIWLINSKTYCFLKMCPLQPEIWEMFWQQIY